MRLSKFLKQMNTVSSLDMNDKAIRHSLGTSRKSVSEVAPVDGVNGQDGVSSHITVAVLQAGADRWHERLQQLRLLQFAEKTQRGATDELIGMLQVLKS